MFRTNTTYYQITTIKMRRQKWLNSARNSIVSQKLPLCEKFRFSHFKTFPSFEINLIKTTESKKHYSVKTIIDLLTSQLSLIYFIKKFLSIVFHFVASKILEFEKLGENPSPAQHRPVKFAFFSILWNSQLADVRGKPMAS